MNEYELGAAIEAAWLPHRATTHIHYLAATSMAAPELCVPAQWPSDRRLQTGDALVFEIARASGVPRAAARDRLRRRRADSAVPRAALGGRGDLRRGGAAACRRDRRRAVAGGDGIAIRSDLVHGFVGGYLPPVLGARQPVPDFHSTGMTVVVQPNVVTRDGVPRCRSASCCWSRDGVERLRTQGGRW